jgi:uncharacterized protein YifE (UPF0438 family)
MGASDQTIQEEHLLDRLDQAIEQWSSGQLLPLPSWYQ